MSAVNEPVTKYSYAILNLLAMALVVVVEWRTDQASVVLAAMVALAAGLGAWRPATFLIPSLGLGLVLPAVYLLAGPLGWKPIYAKAAADPAEALSLALLVFPTLGAAWCAAMFRRWLEEKTNKA